MSLICQPTSEDIKHHFIINQRRTENSLVCDHFGLQGPLRNSFWSQRATRKPIWVSTGNQDTHIGLNGHPGSPALPWGKSFTKASSSSSNWILMSCQPHRVTSGQSNSGPKQTHIAFVRPVGESAQCTSYLGYHHGAFVHHRKGDNPHGAAARGLAKNNIFLVQCCFTSTETIRTIRDGESRTATSTFTQLLSFEQ